MNLPDLDPAADPELERILSDILARGPEHDWIGATLAELGLRRGARGAPLPSIPRTIFHAPKRPHEHWCDIAQHTLEKPQEREPRRVVKVQQQRLGVPSAPDPAPAPAEPRAVTAPRKQRRAAPQRALDLRDATAALARFHAAQKGGAA